MSVTRYRCAACGNLTRFDVVTDRRTRAFHHFSVGGALHIEDEQVLDETVVDVSCRWCGHGREVEAFEIPTSDPGDAVGSDAGESDAGDPAGSAARRVPSAGTADEAAGR